ncbi:hypothetical protein BGZ65_010489 [Modicella reniformis]|uniref:Uncharacterized protein n=1 Tax=Modicella reniformis TaxID=1440133 RepID=A0A9P6LSV0_9FUNG|nr:hypothetical protein BGZ65_010489 [Modicella reniformis]
MLHSSFDCIGEAYHLRPPPGPDHTKKRPTSFDPESNSHNRLHDHTRTLNSSMSFPIIKQDQGKENNQSQIQYDDQDDEEQALQIPARHIAICRAARELRRMSTCQPRKVDLSTDQSHDQVRMNLVGSETKHVYVNTSAEMATSLDNPCAPQEDECSPVVSIDTPVLDERSPSWESLFSEWPPGNQEAARRIEQRQPHQEWSDDPFYNPGTAHTVVDTPSWPVLFSPILLPSDPEDTSVLEALEHLKEDDINAEIKAKTRTEAKATAEAKDTAKTCESGVQEIWCHSDPLPSEWIRMEDWRSTDDSSVNSEPYW